MTLRKISSIIISLGLALGLLGAGVSATFTDSATADMTIQVGTFNIDIASSQGTVNCPAGLGACTITYTAPTIQSSAAGSLPFAFTVTSTGSIPANITVSASSPAAPFTDILGSVASFTLSQSASQTFNAGLSWPVLVNADLGKTTSITYTILATG